MELGDDIFGLPHPHPCLSEASLWMETGKRGPCLQQIEGVGQSWHWFSHMGFKDNLWPFRNNVINRCSLTWVICCFDRTNIKVRQAGESMLSFLPRLLPLFIPQLFVESYCVSGTVLDARGLTVIKWGQTPVLGERTVKCLASPPLRSLGQDGTPQADLKPYMKRGHLGPGWVGPWRCARGSGPFSCRASEGGTAHPSSIYQP